VGSKRWEGAGILNTARDEDNGLLCREKMASHNAARGCAALRMYPDPLREYSGGTHRNDLETDQEGFRIQREIVPDAKP